MSSQMQPFGDESAMAYEELEPARRRHIVGPVLAILVMMIFAGGLWYAYKSTRGHGPSDVPLIRADSAATKIRPEQPGGMAIPDQDKMVYGEAHGQVEMLLPAPETPLPRPVPVAEPPAAAAAPPAAAPSPPPPSPPAALAAQPPAEPIAPAP
ncbi:MAG: hypothetical protein JO010_02835, partial [Alphaproteobacteria bacterium]|nr:hypothetical protein [Alphaproteobacteria bacterium]